MTAAAWTGRVEGRQITESVFATFCAELGTAAYDRCEEMLAKGRALPGAQAVVAELAELPGLVQSGDRVVEPGQRRHQVGDVEVAQGGYPERAAGCWRVEPAG